MGLILRGLARVGPVVSRKVSPKFSREFEE